MDSDRYERLYWDEILFDIQYFYIEHNEDNLATSLAQVINSL